MSQVLRLRKPVNGLNVLQLIVPGNYHYPFWNWVYQGPWTYCPPLYQDITHIYYPQLLTLMTTFNICRPHLVEKAQRIASSLLTDGDTLKIVEAGEESTCMYCGVHS